MYIILNNSDIRTNYFCCNYVTVDYNVIDVKQSRIITASTVEALALAGPSGSEVFSNHITILK